MKQSILIAEDNDFTALQYSKILEQKGHKVVISKNGAECIAIYEKEKGKKIDKFQNPFDVVVLDYSMPKKNGKEVLQFILKLSPYQRIIMASAYSFPLESFSKNGLDNVEFLPKPFSLSKLVREIGN